MSRSPHIAFGLRALAVALKARQGGLREVDRTDLALAALRHVPEDIDVLDAVAWFVALSRRDARGAGRNLQAFIEARAAARAPPAPTPVHNWQTRADLQ